MELAKEEEQKVALNNTLATTGEGEMGKNKFSSFQVKTKNLIF